jgi:hypothetical protein
VTRKPASHVCMMFLGEPGTHVKLILQRPAVSANGRSKTLVVQIERRVLPVEAPPDFRDDSALLSTPVSSADTHSQSRILGPDLVEPSPAVASTAVLRPGGDDSPPYTAGHTAIDHGWRQIPRMRDWEDGYGIDGVQALTQADSASGHGHVRQRLAPADAAQQALPDYPPAQTRTSPAAMHLNASNRAMVHDARRSSSGKGDGSRVPNGVEQEPPQGTQPAAAGRLAFAAGPPP